MKKETTCSKAGESDQGSELNEKANADQPLSESEKDSVTVDQTEETQEHSFTFLRHVMEQRNEADEDGESTDEVLEFHFHKQPSQKHPTRWIIAVVAAVCVLFVGTLALLGANDIYGLFTKEGEPVEIEISSGETVSQIADSLEQNGVIHFSKLFQIYIKQQGMESQLYPGIYQLNQSTDYNTILSTLKTILAVEVHCLKPLNYVNISHFQVQNKHVTHICLRLAKSCRYLQIMEFVILLVKMK